MLPNVTVGHVYHTVIVFPSFVFIFFSEPERALINQKSNLLSIVAASLTHSTKSQRVFLLTFSTCLVRKAEMYDTSFTLGRLLICAKNNFDLLGTASSMDSFMAVISFLFLYIYLIDLFSSIMRARVLSKPIHESVTDIPYSSGLFRTD